jgi:hypothetical protein
MRRSSLVGVTLFLAACSSGGDTPASGAFCADLRAGMSMAQIFTSVADRYDSPAEFAAEAYGHAKISCPVLLTANEDLRTFLEAWGVNPDA